MNSFKLLTVVLFLSTTITSALGCEVKISWEPWAPYQTKENGNPGGLDVDLIKAVLGEAGCKFSFIELPWARQLADNESGNIDIVMAASKTPEREKFANFSAGYRNETVSLFVKNDFKGDLKTVADLGSGKIKLAVTRGNSYSPEVDAMVAKFDATADSDELNLKKVLAGRADGFLCDQYTGINLIKTNNASDKVVISPLQVSTSDVYFMVSKKSKVQGLPEKLTAAIEKLKAKGTIAKIIANYK